MKNGLQIAGRGLAAEPGIVRNSVPARAISVLQAHPVPNAHCDIAIYLWAVHRIYTAGKAPRGFFSFDLDVLYYNILVDAWLAYGTGSDYSGVLVSPPVRISRRLVFHEP
jgi:hypothetical protein